MFTLIFLYVFGFSKVYIFSLSFVKFLLAVYTYVLYIDIN